MKKIKQELSHIKYRFIYGYIEIIHKNNYKILWICAMGSIVGFLLYFGLQDYKSWELLLGIIGLLCFLSLFLLYWGAKKYHTKHYFYSKDAQGQITVTYVRDIYEYKNIMGETADYEEETADFSQENQQKSNTEKNPDENPINYFDGCATLEQAKDRYRKLVKIYHPDVAAGSTSATETINSQYDEFLRNHSGGQ